MTTYICTLGTSIANRLKDDPPRADSRDTPLSRAQKANAPWLAEDELSAAFAKMLARWVDNLLRMGKTDDIDRATAEMTILSKVGVKKDDRVILLATDTFLGKTCAQQLKRVIQQRFGLDDGQIQYDRVEGLQVADAKRAEELGYGNFVECVRRRMDEASQNGYQICICPNGGYKGVVPFLTLLGMLYHARTVYTFEFSNSVIRIPSLPFSLDGEYFSRAEHALHVLTERVEMPEVEFLGLIEDYDPSERELFLGFVQPLGNGLVTPLSLLEHLVSAAETRFAMLSPQAVRDMKAMEGTTNYGVFSKLIMDAQNPQWRDSHVDTYVCSDFIGMKRGDTYERLLGYPVDGLYYVARAVGHDEYDRLLKDGSALQRADFPAESFVKWRPVGVSRKQDWSAFSALSDHCQGLEERVTALQNDVETASQLLTDKEKELQNKSQELARCQMSLQDVQQRVVRVEAEASRLQADCITAKARTTEIEQSSRTLVGSLRLWLSSRRKR